ncbi:MAG: GHKL domain-containing protein [Candidatus Omnitrophica bacterium]|nr:GHKL domain-containing protein [Candidatus Omnitrophota bacterium]
MVLIHVIGSTLSALSILALGIFTLRHNPKEPASRLWFAISVSVSLWSVFYLLAVVPSEHWVLWTSRLAVALACFIPVLFQQTVSSLTRHPSNPVLTRILYLLATGVALMTLLTPWVVEGVKPRLWYAYYPTYGPLSWLFLLTFTANVMLGHAVLIARFHHASETALRPLVLTLIASIVGFGLGATTIPLSYDIPFCPLGDLIFLFVIPLTYAIFRHQLMNTGIVIVRAVLYSLITALLTVGYLMFVLGIENCARYFLGYHSLLVTAGATLLLALTFIPLLQHIQTRLDQRFFRGSLPQLAEERQVLESHLLHADQERSVGIFAAGMAHEIKNPLTTIKILAEKLQTRYEDPLFRDEFSRLVPQEVTKIDRIVRQVLTFARPIPLSFESLQLSTLMDEVLQMLNPQLVDKEIQLRRWYQTTDPCEVDPIQFRQVLVNLLLNAIEAVPRGGRITVMTSSNDGKQSLCIQDSGEGMSDYILAKLGQPFFTNKSGGTGLGLAIVKTIVEEHRGKVRFRSSPGAGTSVELELPGIPLTEALGR